MTIELSEYKAVSNADQARLQRAGVDLNPTAARGLWQAGVPDSDIPVVAAGGEAAALILGQRKVASVP